MGKQGAAQTRQGASDHERNEFVPERADAQGCHARFIDAYCFKNVPKIRVNQPLNEDHDCGEHQHGNVVQGCVVQGLHDRPHRPARA
ncbi:hypothetical protein D3C85_1679560 [compost metagenome]